MQKADCSFNKFKRETARTLMIYFEKVSGRGNKTIVGMIVIIKQVILASKKTTHCTQCYQTPFREGWVMRLVRISNTCMKENFNRRQPHDLDNPSAY